MRDYETSQARRRATGIIILIVSLLGLALWIHLEFQ